LFGETKASAAALDHAPDEQGLGAVGDAVTTFVAGRA
jgi:hypothetical protein